MKRNFRLISLLVGLFVIVAAPIAWSDSLSLAPPKSPSQREAAPSQPSDTGQEQAGEPLRLPDNIPLKTEDNALDAAGITSVSDVQGRWRFDRDFVDSQGTSLQADFAFDENGKGMATLTNRKGQRFEADNRVTVNKGRVHVETDSFKDSNGSVVYADMQFDCRNTGNGTVCDSTDRSWAGEHLIAQDARAMAHTKGTRTASKQETAKTRVEDTLTLPNTAEKPIPRDTQALYVPKQRDISVTEGTWSFDKNFVDSKGDTVRTVFQFDRNGQGTTTLINSKNERFTAKSTATLDDGVLRIQTEQFLNDDGSKAYPNLFLECANVNGRAVCKGSDGWKVWDKQHLLAQDGTAAQNAMRARAEKRAPQGQSVYEEPADTGHTDQNALVELSEGGAELSPVLLANSKKAQGSTGSVAGLAGDWRYSRDFARKSDGSSVSLEFHFDANGQGYSTVNDGSANKYQAKAEAMAMPNGTYRVKTETYSNGGQGGYYPTFMECRPKQNRELSCDVSNGWMRLTDGALVSLSSINQREGENRMEELLATTPAPQKSQKKTQVNTEDLLAQLAETANEPETPQPKPQKKQALVLPKAENSMSFLQGRWRCNTGLVRSTDGEPIVVEFSFNDQGKGTSVVRERSGVVYTASANAIYKKGRLRINTSDFYSNNAKGRYYGQFVECTQNSGYAICTGKSRDNSTHWENATFNRLR